ncbi:CHAT domain-containing protein [Tunicatimonas pelagia]|uniref:CHAT domain-containing protein n=1 Tax=Tunicatimonas pelagia TaxID=931531 RepID=UPI002664ED92|nr:CHAT domain-containing protein [Tunicatimonas pelagia]WKN41599.1 CHAT domain-containing protein [Tunicatimonas pelagia]
MFNSKVLVSTALVGFFSSLSAKSQVLEPSSSNAEVYFEKGEALFNLDDATEDTYDLALEYYQRTINLLNNQDTLTTTLAQCYQRIGSIYLDRDALEDALEMYHLSRSIKTATIGIKDSLLYSDYVLIGNVYYYTDQYDSAEYYYGLAENVASIYEDNLADIERLYNSLGVFNFTLGNYQKATTYYDKALSVMPEEGYDYVIAKVIFTYHIALARHRLNQHDEAIKRYYDALEFEEQLPQVYRALIHSGLGNTYLASGHYDSALLHLNQAQRAELPFLRMSNSNRLGNLFMKKDQLGIATEYYEQTIQINNNEKRGKNTHVATAYQGLGDVALTGNAIQKALRYYQLSLINTTYGFNETDIARNPNNKYQAILPLKQFKVLHRKGNAFVKYYEQNQDTTNLQHALNCFQEAIRVARYTQKTYDNEEAKLFFVNQVHSLYEDAIRTTYQLYQLSGDDSYAELALQFSERSKASVLTEILREVDIKASGEVNDSLVSEERLLKQQITANRLKLVESSDSAQNEEFRKKINDLEIALARVVKQLQQDEKYYQLKYQEDTLDLSVWQSQLLSEDDLLLEYFMGEEQLYVFAIEQNSLAMHQVALDTAFRTTWKKVQDHLFAYDYGDTYQPQWSVQLYRKLIEPIAGSLTQKKRLIVIPAGELSYLPFEMLTESPQEDKFLLHDYTISYAFSGTLLYNAHLRETTQASKQEVLAMAPFAGRNVRSVRDNSLSPLYFSRQEVASVGGSLYLEEEATKQLFLKIAGSYNILHLATHASVNDENPLQSFIAFYPQEGQSIASHRLFTHELYNLRLDSVNLVVLSSCDAGNGRLVKGEGIISLARAFAYAGCPNIITTLWKADDKAAADIASKMHQYLKNGYAKDEALRQAKLDYLRDPETKELRTPYYWANFVFIGDPTPIYESSPGVWWIISGVIILLLAGSLIIIVKRQQRSNR